MVNYRPKFYDVFSHPPPEHFRSMLFRNVSSWFANINHKTMFQCSNFLKSSIGCLAQIYFASNNPTQKNPVSAELSRLPCPPSSALAVPVGRVALPCGNAGGPSGQGFPQGPAHPRPKWSRPFASAVGGKGLPATLPRTGAFFFTRYWTPGISHIRAGSGQGRQLSKPSSLREEGDCI